MSANPFSPDYDGTVRSHLGGASWRFAFPNGYGASVVQHWGSYGGPEGLWELAVLNAEGHLTYDTPITEDVIGHLSETAVADLLAQIAALPAIAVAS